MFELQPAIGLDMDSATCYFGIPALVIGTLGDRRGCLRLQTHVLSTTMSCVSQLIDDLRPSLPTDRAEMNTRLFKSPRPWACCFTLNSGTSHNATFCLQTDSRLIA